MQTFKHTFGRIGGFLGLNRNMGAMLAMVVLIGLGEKMAERFLPIYLLALGGGAIAIGALNGLDNLLSALYSYPGGYLSDRLGYKNALAVFNLIAMAGYLIVILFPHWQAVFIGSFFFLSWTAISLPATMSMVSMVLPENKRTMGVTMHSLIRRIPMAAGPILGGAMISIFGVVEGICLSFLVAFVLAAVSLIVQQILIDEKQLRKRAEGNIGRLWKYISTPLRNLLVADILIRFAEQIPYAFVVVWCIQLNHISAFQFGVLTAIEMITAMLVYIPVARLADRGTKKPYVLITFFNFSIFPLVLMFSHSFAMLVVAFIVRGLKEFGEPSRKALIMDLAPPDMKAGVFGLYYLIRDIIVSMAAFGGAFLWIMAPSLNLLCAALCGFAGVVYFWIFGRDNPIVKILPE